MSKWTSGSRHWTKRHPEWIRRGTQAPGAKLTPAGIERLLLLDSDGMLPGEIAAELNVSRQTIWRHLKANGRR